RHCPKAASGNTMSLGGRRPIKGIALRVGGSVGTVYRVLTGSGNALREGTGTLREVFSTLSAVRFRRQEMTPNHSSKAHGLSLVDFDLAGYVVPEDESSALAGVLRRQTKESLGMERVRRALFQHGQNGLTAP